MPQVSISSIIRARATAQSYLKESTNKIDEDVFNFLKENPNPSDAQVHTFAEEKKYDVHNLEKEIYKLATRFISFMTSGIASEKGITEKDVDPKQLKKGIKIELEHTKDNSIDIAKKVTLDHLAEIPNYYDLLEKMEKAVEH